MRVEDVAKYIGVNVKVVARVVTKDKNKKKNRMEFRSHPNIIIICYFIEQLVVARGFPRCKPNRIPDILAVRKIDHLNIKTKMFDIEARSDWLVFASQPIRTRASKLFLC